MRMAATFAPKASRGSSACLPRSLTISIWASSRTVCDDLNSTDGVLLSAELGEGNKAPATCFAKHRMRNGVGPSGFRPGWSNFLSTTAPLTSIASPIGMKPAPGRGNGGAGESA